MTASNKPLSLLMLGAIGVVYGDIGTSPLYALKECFSGQHGLPMSEANVMGLLSLIFWFIMLVVTFKYVSVIMRADNHGEGGSLALLSIVTRITRNSALASVVAVLGVFAAALFYGDSMLTPAISVLSAVEGLGVAAPALDHFVVPLTLVIITGLFMIQSRGTASVGVLFGPVMCLWFLVLAVLGVVNIIRVPSVLWALSPTHAIGMFVQSPWVTFVALGSVVLALTGAEALYADMGHFGKRPIRLSWLWIILPSLTLNYFGQGALLLEHPEAVRSPFFNMVPQWALLPMVLLATAATVIASQAVISGAFSVTRQAVQLGLLPRISTVHTSESEEGQIYIPFINWTLFYFVVLLVLGFRSSSNLAAAYGVAVTGTMLIDSLLLTLVMFLLWRWKAWIAVSMALLFIAVDAVFFAANSIKIPHGGWFPLAIGIVIFTMLTTWKRGRALMAKSMRDSTIPMEAFLADTDNILRVPGTAVFMTATEEGIPSSLLHNLKHNKVLHEKVVLLTVYTLDHPYVDINERIRLTNLGRGIYRLVINFGYMDYHDVPQALQQCAGQGLRFEAMDTSYFLNRETLIPSKKPGMARWREVLFAWMVRNAATPMKVFRLPPNRIIELGQQVQI